MSHIAGRLLCIARDGKKMKSLEVEACAFYLLRKICDKFCPTTYCDGMEGLHESCENTYEVIRDRILALSTYLEARGSSHHGIILATDWFLPLFCADFTKKAICRIVDVIITDGTDAMYAFAIAILRMNQAYLMNSDLDFFEIFGYLKKSTMRMTNVDFLVANAKREWRFTRTNIAPEEPRRNSRASSYFD
uniref:Putative RabGAP/TBC domaincontaining protein n=1 Tax=Albugo laibachii Nc14 TaxID=890382 RepID=F0WVW0_9STRA|nr:putative RabGAP/TBC domaincontaining protein [Albugo laibachii Nc14]|eukprot:CCA25560.1 putative RabGAP/TBC domaincontaining protein [Albugo laibachii Nc14]